VRHIWDNPKIDSLHLYFSHHKGKAFHVPMINLIMTQSMFAY